MGEFVAGTPALQIDVQVSLPLDLVSAMSLLYRAVPGSGLDPWLVASRRALPAALRADLDLLHGFSGRLLYYMEEPVLRFEPLRPDRRSATAADLFAFLESLPPADYREMVAHALERVHRDLARDAGDLPAAPAAPGPADEAGWLRFLEPGLTTASADDVLPLVLAPEHLKRRTLDLIRGVWDQAYGAEYARWEPTLREAARLARTVASPNFGPAFEELTGNRPPATLVAGLPETRTVTFCPSPHLGSYVSSIHYPPDLVVFFGAPELLHRLGAAPASPLSHRAGAANGDAAPALADDELLDALRALADPNRLRILDLLADGELYAQEIVGRLGVAQSAVSRHLAQLERAGLVRVRPRGGLKYYAVAPERLDLVASGVAARSRASR